MSKFKSAGRTIVTEVKSFVVDTVARTGTFRQSVSARVPHEATFNRQDVNVTSLLPYVLDDVSVVAGIHTPEPVRVVLTQLVPTPDPEVPDDTPAPPVFDTPQNIFASDPLPITLRDESIRSMGVVNIVVLNLVTGETETILLQSSEPGVFEGVLPTMLSTAKSLDFDGTMGVINGHTLLLRYNSGTDVLAEAQVQIKSQYVDSAITTPLQVFVGKPIPIVIEDIDLTGRVLSATVLNLNTGQELNPILSEIEAGVFYTQIETSETPDANKLVVADGQSVSISFTSDRYSNTPTVEKVVNVSSPYHVPVDLSIDTNIGVGDKILVALSDYNRVGSSSISIAVSNVRSREFKMVTCSESIPNSGIFIGELPTRLGSSRDAALGIEPGDSVSAVYIDTAGAEPIRIESIGIVDSSDSALASVSVKELEVPEPLVEQSVEFIVNGLFFLNGTFNGKMSVYGLTEEYVRCSVLHA